MVFLCARNEDGIVCIGDKSLRKYIPKHIKPMGKKNKLHADAKHVSVPCYFKLILINDGSHNLKDWISSISMLHQEGLCKYLR